MVKNRSKFFLSPWRRWANRRNLTLPLTLLQKAPLDLRIVSRMLLHAAIVGAAAGLAGAAFFTGAEYMQHLLLEMWAGYAVLRAHGEALTATAEAYVFRPWLLCLLPALGALVGGLLSTFAPETHGGGGGNAMIAAFHQGDALVRVRVIWVRALAAIATLGSGGSGGREGPTMQIGGAIGATVARLLRMSTRERRILYIAGVAAGMAAVFRTPFGAALLAVEVLYRDDFEAEALIPAISASVVAYSVVIALFGEGTSLFGNVPHFRFVPAHLPLYALLALGVAGIAVGFTALLDWVHHVSDRLPLPIWLRPACGGLVLGLMATPIISLMSDALHAPRGTGLGLLGSGYGEVQLVLTGSPWLPNTWHSVYLLLLLLICKLVASCCTLGTGGSAGDFAPSLVLGGLSGGIFGRVTALLTQDPSIDPGAFVLVGMATFYGGIAHTPLGSLMMACEMAGSYDLLVPLMLTESVAFVALRRRSLYSAQVTSQRDSPVHRDVALSEALRRVSVAEIMQIERPFTTFTPQTAGVAMLELSGQAVDQAVFPVLDKARLVGVVTAEALRLMAAEYEAMGHTIAADMMQPAVVVQPTDTLRVASAQLINHGTRAAVVVNVQGEIISLLDETDIAQVYLKAAARAEALS